jgi:hypothetical protein
VSLEILWSTIALVFLASIAVFAGSFSTPVTTYRVRKLRTEICGYRQQILPFTEDFPRSTHNRRFERLITGLPWDLYEVHRGAQYKIDARVAVLRQRFEKLEKLTGKPCAWFWEDADLTDIHKTANKYRRLLAELRQIEKDLTRLCEDARKSRQLFLCAQRHARLQGAVAHSVELVATSEDVERHYTPHTCDDALVQQTALIDAGEMIFTHTGGRILPRVGSDITDEELGAAIRLVQGVEKWLKKATPGIELLESRQRHTRKEELVGV